MENRYGVRGGPQGNGHIAQLRQRGIRNDSLDIVLNNSEKTHEKCRNGTNHQYEIQSCITQLKNW